MLLKWQPQVIHIQWLRIPTFDVFFLKFVKRMTRCKIVFTAHNILPHRKGNSSSDSKEAYRKMYQLADVVIVHTQSTKNELLSIFSIAEGKVSVINHGLLNLTYDPNLLQQQEKQFNDHYMTEKCFIFSALGFQYEYKGVDLLVDMWKNTPELCNNSYYKLLLIGKNRGVDLSAANGIDNIIVEDREMSDEEFYYLLTHTDVYILPYKKISQSGALMSAITTGTPMLVTETGGLTEPFKIAQIGWTIPANNVSALRDKMLWLVEHPEEINYVKNNREAWEKVRNHYSWENIAKQTYLLYHNI
jgi:Glycosyltransferase